MNFRIIALLIMLCFSTVTHCTTMQVPLVLAQDKALKATFTQKRFLHGLPKPIVSKGALVVHRDGIIWKTLTPFPSKLLINNRGIFEISNETYLALVGKKETANHMGFMFDVFCNILQGIITENEDFEVSSTIDKSVTIYKLVPKNANFLKVITCIVVHIDKTVRNITIARTQGAYDEINFDHDQIVSINALTSAEQKFLKKK